MSARPDTPLLDRVNKPEDLKHLSDAELARLADELRAETISAVSETGGHLGAGLGVVELTVALHLAFDSPHDVLLPDIPEYMGDKPAYMGLGIKRESPNHY